MDYLFCFILLDNLFYKKKKKKEKRNEFSYLIILAQYAINMNHVVQRVKNALSLQHFTISDSWLNDCIEYYLTEHENVKEYMITIYFSNNT